MVRSSLILGILLALLLALGCSADTYGEIEEYPAEPFGTWSYHEWKDPDGAVAAQGLMVQEAAARGVVQRFLLRDAADHRVVLTTTTLPRQGLHRYVVRDDSSGWWAELELDYDHQWSGFRHYVLTVDDLFPPRSDKQVTYRFRTSSDVSLTTAGSAPEGDSVDRKHLVARLEESGQLERLQREMPIAVRSLLPLLRREVERVSYGDPSPLMPHRALILSLIEAASADGGEVDLPTLTRSQVLMKPGLGVDDPRVLAFTSRFRSVSNADPLGDHRLAEVIPPEPEAGEPPS